jgi:hypothetical protein
MTRSEPEFVNVKGAQKSIPKESIPLADEAWRAGIITLFVVPARQVLGIDS